MNKETIGLGGAVAQGFKQGSREALKTIGIGQDTRWGKVKRWFFVPQLVLGAALLPLMVYNFAGTPEMSGRARVENVMDMGPVINKIEGDLVRVELLDGPYAGKRVAFNTKVGKTYTPGQEFVVVYRDTRLMGPNIKSVVIQ